MCRQYSEDYERVHYPKLAIQQCIFDISNVTQKSDDWYKKRQYSVGASQITELIEQKYNSIESLIINWREEINADAYTHAKYENVICMSYGTLVEPIVHDFLHELIESGQIQSLKGLGELPNILNACFCDITNTFIASPDSIKIESNTYDENISSHSHTIHIFEYKAPLKRPVKNLHWFYFHQLNYAVFVIKKKIEAHTGYKLNSDEFK